MVDFITAIVYLSIYIGLIATSFYILSFFADKGKKKLFYRDKELPFVSVIIPAYNEEKSIERTISSIMQSEYPKFEIIIVDDGSKDKTFQLAKRFESKQIKVFSKENGGKASALNFGIAKSKGEIIFSMDADTMVSPKSMKRMVRFFKDKKVMSVSPAMIVSNAQTLWQRIQSVEYFLGIFLRKAFSSLNAVFITPGAFSAYRKSFFEKHGGYDENNITEDLELSLRIQFKGYVTKNCPTASAYTIAPRTFKQLLIQRRRWYFGLMINTWNYRKIFSRKYGDLGLFVMPIAWISIFFAVFVTVYLFIKTLFDVKNGILFLQSINFDFVNTLNFNLYFLERFLFLFLTNKILLFILLFLSVTGFYIVYASKKVGRASGLFVNLPLFFLFFAILFGFWWIVSIFYVIFVGKVKWR